MRPDLAGCSRSLEPMKRGKELYETTISSQSSRHRRIVESETRRVDSFRWRGKKGARVRSIENQSSLLPVVCRDPFNFRLACRANRICLTEIAVQPRDAKGPISALCKISLWLQRLAFCLRNKSKRTVHSFSNQSVHLCLCQSPLRLAKAPRAINSDPSPRSNIKAPITPAKRVHRKPSNPVKKPKQSRHLHRAV